MDQYIRIQRLILPQDINRWIKFLLLGFVVVNLTSCSIKKHIPPEKTLLTKNTVQIDNEVPIKGKRDLKWELETVIRRKPNKKFLGLTRTRLWYYYKVDEPQDTSRIDRWIKKQIAEPPAFYELSETEKTAEAMRYMLQTKAYFNARVEHDADIGEHFTEVTYTAFPGQRYLIDSLQFVSEDSVVQSILNRSKDDSFLREGAPASEEVFDKEAIRITSLLKNRGYAFFDVNYLNPIGDTAQYKVDVTYEILLPPNQTKHETYRIGKVTIDPHYVPAQRLELKIDTTINGRHFLKKPDEKLFVKSSTLLRNTFLNPGDLYRQENFQNTNNQLGALEIYKFIAIRPTVDTLTGNQLDFLIQLTPTQKMAIGGDVELNNSDFTGSVSRVSLIGAAANLNFRNRNAFRSATRFLTRFSSGVELDLGNRDQIVFSRNIDLNMDFYFPKFLDLTRQWKVLNKIKPVRRSFMGKFYRAFKEKANTRLSLEYSNLLLFDFYGFNSFGATYGYDLQLSQQHRFVINQIGINLLFAETQPSFDELIIDNPLIGLSFQDQIFTGFGLPFQGFEYYYTGKRNRFGVSHNVRADFEISGLEIHALNGLSNWIQNVDQEWQLRDMIEFSKHIKIELDGRRYRQYNSNNILAFRLNTGLAFTYGQSDEVPFVKQFFVGGPNSIRAWQIRELGPGGYVDPITNDPSRNIPFYQTGDFKLEFSAEYRFPIFLRLKGALFLDGGNIWTLKRDEARLGSQLRFTQGATIDERPFWEQIALGTGLGFRLDATYFVIRFDMGLRMRRNFIDPDDPTETPWLFNEWRDLQFRDFNYNLAIGYPF